jgi:hypothetical protein
MPNNRRTSSWHEIAAFYRELIDERSLPFRPMLDLVEFLASPRYGRSLFPCMSGDILLVGRALDFKPEDGELQIRFDGNQQTFKFTYMHRPGELDPWSRDCEASEWRRVLERLLHKRLQWFHEG